VSTISSNKVVLRELRWDDSDLSGVWQVCRGRRPSYASLWNHDGPGFCLFAVETPGCAAIYGGHECLCLLGWGAIIGVARVYEMPSNRTHGDWTGM
jgi:hypothetical protein